MTGENDVVSDLVIFQKVAECIISLSIVITLYKYKDVSLCDRNGILND